MQLLYEFLSTTSCDSATLLQTRHRHVGRFSSHSHYSAEYVRHFHTLYFDLAPTHLIICVVGFGLAGTLQGVLVKPIAMIFPSSLVYVELYHTLHQGSKATQDKLRFFALAFIACLVYQVSDCVFDFTLKDVIYVTFKLMCTKRLSRPSYFLRLTLLQFFVGRDTSYTSTEY